MSTQSEAILENNLIQQLVGLGYAPVRILQPKDGYEYF